MDIIDDLVREIALLTAQRDEMAGQLATIRASLDRVAVFEDVDTHAYLTLCVSEIVRDHEELEARIDAAIMAIASTPPDHPRLIPTIVHYLRGGQRVPESTEGVEGG